MQSQIFHDELARVAKAVGHPIRLQVLDVLVQGARNVEELCRRLDTPMSTLSSQLRVLRDARLVSTRREGTSIYYAVADPTVRTLLLAIRAVAETRSAAVQQVVAEYLYDVDGLTAITADEATTLLDQGKVVIIDVRPREEFEAGHIPGAISMPLDELPGSASTLPKRQRIVAYCRDAYCVLAPEAIRILARQGYETQRLDIGFAEWATDHHIAKGA